MTRDLVADIAQGLWKFCFQQAIAFAGHEVFKRVPHVRLHQLRIRTIGEHQRQFLLEHEGATRHGGHDGKAIFGVSRQHRNIRLFRGFDAVQITQLQLGHTAAFFFFNQHVGNFVVVENFQQIMANAWLVVVDVAG